MKEVLARALRALAVSPLNCSLILDADGLEPLTEMLCGPDQELAHQALVVMSLLSKVGRKQGYDDAPIKAISSRIAKSSFLSCERMQ